MTNQKRTKDKIIGAVASLLLLVCSVFVIAASAEEPVSGRYEIIAKNVTFGDKTYISFAVDCSVESASDITVEYYYENSPEKVYRASYNPDFSYSDKNGTEDTSDDLVYPTFMTVGFAPQDYTERICAVAYSGDFQPTDESYITYSVAEYVYSRLYKHGYINKTDKRADFYLDMLDFAESAQILLDNSPENNPSYDPENPETLITEYRYVFTELDGARINGESDSVLLKYGSSVSLTAPELDGNGSPFVCWQLLDAKSGELIDTVGNNEVFPLTSHVKAVAVYGEAVSEGRGSGKYASDGATLTFDDLNFDSSLAYPGEGDGYIEIAKDDNDYALRFSAEELSTTTGFNVPLISADIDCAIAVEFDVLIKSAAFTRDDGFLFDFGNDESGRGNLLTNILFLHNSGRNLYFASGDNTLVSAALNLGDWYTVRIELSGTEAGDTAEIFINGKSVHTLSLDRSVAEATVFTFFTYNNKGFIGEMYFDNIFAAVK